MSNYKSVDVKVLYDLFTYDSVTGSLYWKQRPSSHFATERANKIWNGRFAGKEAGTLHKSKKSKAVYRIVKVGDTMVLSHLIVWALAYGVWPETTIDHVDLNGLNNRLDNLREATATSQLKNRPKREDNTSGKTGVSWHKCSGTWNARISVDGEEVSLGFYNDKDEAIKVRVQAERKYGYETGLREGYDSIIV